MSASERAMSEVIESIERVGNETTVTLCGELDVLTTAVVEEVLENECGRKPSRITVDLAAVEFVDSSALHAFVVANKQLEAHGGALRIISVTDPIRRTFEITQLDRLFLPDTNGNGRNGSP